MMANLLPEYRLGDLILTDYPYGIEFAGDHGAPETVTELVEMWQADGDDEQVVRHGNREMTLTVVVEGADHGELTENENALRSECRKPGLVLEFDSGDGFTPTTVFEITVATARHAKDDAHEMSNMRRWELTLRAKPFVRSKNPTVAEVSAVGSVPRQASFIIPVGGTERTTGSLRVSTSTGTGQLRLTLVHTTPDDGSDYHPSLHARRIAGNALTADSTTYSGAREALSPDFFQAEVPIAEVPTGTYQLMMLARSTTAANVNVDVSVQAWSGGVKLGEHYRLLEQGNPIKATFPLPNDWRLVPLGVVRLPVVRQMAGTFRFVIRTPEVTNVEFDEAWAFRIDGDSGLSIIHTDQPHLWVDSEPALWVGSAPDKSDARYPVGGIYTMGIHHFTPGDIKAFVATGAPWPAARLSYHKRWHSHVGED